ncbi:bacterial NAD-glutamate dehydrogenase family protein [Orientia chuto str. Dubai]|uniref:Bacterial NAD-glutamate dehydrogenase family protein n=1 Tax=Orientia chuto str. Dubai TaxID=1359168 RepID=A0A0F3ML39_9RICK|nr:NAD-glutamate dehydrogenase domain-containing protein [Candidatus Orientia mediorientalis]KJV56460.1 bacterial NAD-glutamate dehydrogenase family protein [Orientia chuto str. Dubai]
MNNQDLDIPLTSIFSCDNTKLQTEVINAIKSEPKYSNDTLLIKFVKSFYSYIPIDYTENYSTNFFKDAALSAYEFFKKKPINKNYLVTLSQSNQSSYFSPFIEFKIINIDAAFIIDSIKSLLERIGLEPFFFIHPVVATKRNKNGALVDVFPAFQNNNHAVNNNNIESLILCKIHGTFDKKFLDSIKSQLTTILEQINKTSADWHPILQEIEKIITSLSHSSDQEKKSIVDFLHWLKADNFTFLSCINYNLLNGTSSLVAGHKAFFPEQDIENIMHLACNQGNDKKTILIGKINKPSTVHKSSFINYMLIKQKNKNGSFDSAMIFLGLYSASTKQQSVQNIPILLDKLKDILSFSKFSSNSYNAKRFKAIFESLPREMLFEASLESLYCACLKVLSAMNNNALRLCLFPNCLNNIIDIIVFLPSIRLTPNVHANITSCLIKAFNTKILSSELNTVPPNFCSIYISMPIDQNVLTNLNIKELENNLENLSAQWIESFKASLVKSYGLFEGLKLFKDNAYIFPKNYIQNFNSAEAVNDLKYIIKAQKSGKQTFNFIIHSQHIFSLKIYNPGSKLSLSQVFPIIENLNFNILDEQTFKISTENSRPLISQLALDSNKQELVDSNFNIRQDLNALYSMNSNQSDI